MVSKFVFCSFLLNDFSHSILTNSIRLRASVFYCYQEKHQIYFSFLKSNIRNTCGNITNICKCKILFNVFRKKKQERGTIAIIVLKVISIYTCGDYILNTLLKKNFLVLSPIQLAVLRCCVVTGLNKNLQFKCNSKFII